MWIARDSDGSLWIFLRRPHKEGSRWTTCYDFERLFKLSDNYYPEVKWEDKEPRELILK